MDEGDGGVKNKLRIEDMTVRVKRQMPSLPFTSVSMITAWRDRLPPPAGWRLTLQSFQKTAISSIYGGQSGPGLCPEIDVS